MPPVRFTDSSPFKVSCLKCRAAKRKCDSIDTSTRCARCTAQDLDCEYTDHHRGRRPAKGSTAASVAAAAVSDRAQEAGPSTSSALSSSPRHSPNSPPRGASRQAPAQFDSFHHSPTHSPHLNGTTSGIRFSHVIPIEGDSWPYIQKDVSSRSRLPHHSHDYGQEHAIVERLLASHCPDPVQACILTPADVPELFDMFFSTLNLLVPILDPLVTRADACQQQCPLLFTAILTITSKVLRPKAYMSCLLLANKLVGQAVEQGKCSVSIVQAILILVHFKEPEDNTGWRRIGYAIRMALELRLNDFRPRSISENSWEARIRLNGQRTWLNLLISDYHMAIHHSLPRMITNDGIEDVDAWLKEHTSLQVRGENILPALITFSRMCRHYADMVEGMNGDTSNLRLLSWVERDYQQWTRRYITPTSDKGADSTSRLEQLQKATLLLCDSFFSFHIAEYKLLFRVRHQSKGAAGNSRQPTELSYTFHQCVEAALGPSTIFLREYGEHGLLPYASNILWVALAVTGVWLIHNARQMYNAHRQQVFTTLDAVQVACQEASCTPADPPAYMSRLLQHLLHSQYASSTSNRMDDLLSFTVLRPGDESARQLIQGGLWSRRASFLGAEGTSAATRDTTTPSNGVYIDQDSGLLFPATDDDFWRFVFPFSEIV